MPSAGEDPRKRAGAGGCRGRDEPPSQQGDFREARNLTVLKRRHGILLCPYGRTSRSRKASAFLFVRRQCTSGVVGCQVAESTGRARRMRATTRSLPSATMVSKRGGATARP